MDLDSKTVSNYSVDRLFYVFYMDPGQFYFENSNLQKFVLSLVKFVLDLKQ